MKFLLLFSIAAAAYAAQWDSIQRMSVDQKIEVTTADGMHARGTFVSSTAETLVLREPSGERSVARSEVRRVRVSDPARRIRRGLLWMVVGAGGGAAAGVAACPSCPNEGHTSPYIGPGVAAGAAIGAIGFLSSPYRTVYRSR